jgi:aromatic-L-amino-acid decarboxylase
MTPEEFRVAGHKLIDWITDYRLGLDELPVRAQVDPGQVKSHFSDTPPEAPVEFDALLEELERAIVPGITQAQHPMHFGWFPSNASLASVLGDITSSGLGTLGISWESCPALTEVEEVVCDWMRQLTGLSEKWEGTIHDTASTACLTALLVARERASEYLQNTTGLQGNDQPLIVYATREAHSSIVKSALLAGFGKNNLRFIDVDPLTRSMRSDALARQIEEDRINNCKPAVIAATAGTTGVTAFDPILEITDIAKRYDIWVHVDAAMAGTAMLLPECRHLWNGVEDADSISWNPHKWMGTILDCALFYVRDPQYLIRVMSTNPSYLRSTVDGGVTQYRDWGIPLGRRFRALKLLFQLRLDGPDAIRARIRDDLDNARWFAKQVQSDPEWEVVAPVTLQTVCIRHHPQGLSKADLDSHTLSWVNAINASGSAFMSPSMLDDQWMVRVSIGVEATTRKHVSALWDLIRRYAASASSK